MRRSIGEQRHRRPTANGHANDSDTIVGDNGDIIRLVGVNGNGVGAVAVALGRQRQPTTCSTTTTTAAGQDHSARASACSTTRRAAGLQPGPRGQTTSAAADEIHGESGDDFIYGGKGNDVLYGEGQDDDIIGGYGNDWISGGTGDDGILGDDGRIYTSRNSATATEPSRSTASCPASDADPKYSNGNALNEFIYTPGNIQTDTINVSGALKKTVDLTPFSVDPTWNAQPSRRPTRRPSRPPTTTSSSAAWATTGSTAARATTRCRAPRRCPGGESYTHVDDATLRRPGIAGMIRLTIS